MNRPPPLIDTHAHLDDRRLKERIQAVLHACVEGGVIQVVAVATTAEDSASVVGLARRHSGVFATVGIHPNEAGEAQPGDWDRVRSLAIEAQVVAIGETGLDRHWDRTPFDVQQDYFDRHLDLARELDRPIIIHSRDCHADIIEQLSRRPRPIQGILHSFAGNWAEAEEVLELGLHISFAGMLTFANKALDSLREAAALVPIERLLVETDSPYLTPHPFRGKTNEPARVALTAAKLAEIRGMSFSELAEKTTSNAQRLFSLPSDQIIAAIPDAPN